MRLYNTDLHREPRERRFERYLRRNCPTAKDFHVDLLAAFNEAAREVDAISMTTGVLGGTPCIRGTRIPVYMVLDAIEHYGSLKGALRSYPQLKESQVKDAIKFAKLVMERPVDDKTENPDR